MLTEIRCDKFIEEPIIFKSGLNSILGDDYSTNSIGKSTLLMIIDFVLGGNSFIDNNSGAINKLGHLTFKFCYKFKSEFHYFIRTTSENNIIGICDNEYNIISETDVESFTNILKRNYCSNIQSSFRSTINPYSRIWKKDNYNVDKPILNFYKEAESASIENLIKLFGLYTEISIASNEIKSQEESRKILSGMFKKNIVPNITKANFIKNEKEIERINKDIEDIKDNLLKYTLNIEELSNKEIIELKTQKQKLLDAQSIILNKIRRLEINLNNTSVKSKYFNRLSQFFENPNETKIKEIEKFHNNLSKILQRELEATKEILEKENEVFNTQIATLDQKLDTLLENVQSPKFIVEKIYDLTIQANRLNENNKLYKQKEDVTQDVKILNINLEQTVNVILNEIEAKINNELIRINKEIHTDQKKIPRITLRRKSYNFDHSSNTGTGKSYADLIEFDLAILKLTDLPLIIHDSVLFKNIEDKAIDKVIEQYSLFDKQIFIALDGINKFSENSQKILINKCAIQLSENNKLFNVDWR
jgi:Chromosome segregation ATPases